jgi:hypothetical protein
MREFSIGGAPIASVSGALHGRYCRLFERVRAILGVMRAAASLLALLLGLAANAPPPPGFSIDAASPSTSAGSNSAILAPGPVGGPPAVAVPPAALGLGGGSVDELNAMTFGAGAPGLTFHFSVDRASVGLAGDVVAQAAAGQVAGDLFATALSGTNSLALNQRELGLVPATLPGTPATGAIDDVDAFDFAYDGASVLIVYALEHGHAEIGTAVGCGGDLFFAGSLFLGYAALGLGSCLDDVDALEIDTTSNRIYYSLAPGSPSLAPGSPIGGCASGCSAADLFSIQPGAPTATLFATAASLGLLASDNVDALALGPAPPPAVPALGPGGALLLAGLLASAAMLRHRRAPS